MNFSSPASAWLLALLVPLVIFYFLKLRRPRQTIPSLVLWRQVLSDQRVNSPFQRFKRNILLLLQILLLLALVLAAMQPWIRSDAGATTKRLPIIIDVSASMAALDREGGTTRLAALQKNLRERIDTLPPGQELCLVAFAGSALRLTGFTSSKAELRAAVDALRVEDVPGSLEEALQLVEAIARTTPFERVLLLTDGNLPSRTRFELPFQLDLQKLAPAGPNAGITQLNARRTTDSNSEGWEVFVQLAATDPPPAASATILFSFGESEIARETITLAPGDSPRFTFRIRETGNAGGLLRAELRPAGFDALESDNRAWLSLPSQRPLEIFVPENMPLYREALSVNGGVRILPTPGATTPSSYDLAFAASEEALPPTRVGCTTGTIPEPLRALLTMENVAATAIDWQRESPLLQYVSLDDVLFSEAPAYATGRDENALAALGYETLASAARGPLIIARDEATGPNAPLRVHFLFSVERSTLPYRVAFPVLISNLVAEARQRAGLGESAATRTGVIAAGGFQPGSTVQVRPPTGPAFSVTADGRGSVTGVPALQAGEYALEGDSQRIGVSLLSAEETGLTAVDAVEFGDRVSVTAAAANPRSDRSLWRLFATAGFALLLLEWWWFQALRWKSAAGI